MYRQGISDSSSTKIEWIKGYAENTKLNSQSADWVSMASSLHWVDLEKGLMNQTISKM